MVARTRPENLVALMTLIKDLVCIDDGIKHRIPFKTILCSCEGILSQSVRQMNNHDS